MMPDSPNQPRDFVAVDASVICRRTQSSGDRQRPVGRAVQSRRAFHAIDGICLHRGGPLAEGQLIKCVVTCPWHGWQFDVTTGALVQDPKIGVSRHDTRIVGDQVQIRLND